MDIVNFINQYWLIFGAIFGSTIWFIRLEATVMNLKTRIDMHGDSYKELWSKINEIQSSLASIATSLARLEGRLEGNKNE